MYKIYFIKVSRSNEYNIYFVFSKAQFATLKTKNDDIQYVLGFVEQYNYESVSGVFLYIYKTEWNWIKYLLCLSSKELYPYKLPSFRN